MVDTSSPSFSPPPIAVTTYTIAKQWNLEVSRPELNSSSFQKNINTAYPNSKFPKGATENGNSDGL